jgi:hypothetical protein
MKLSIRAGLVVLICTTVEIVLTVSSYAAAPVPKESDDLPDVSTVIPRKTRRTSGDERGESNFLGLLNYSPADLLIPRKAGVTLGLIPDPNWTWEFEYLRSTLSVPFLVDDLGKMSDVRMTLNARSFAGRNSFNFSYGLNYFDFSLNLGNEILSRLMNGAYAPVDAIVIRSLGFNFGIGNRWSFNRNIVFGIDWFSWSQPIYVTTRRDEVLQQAVNPAAKAEVDTAVKLISYVPRFVLFKIQVGIQF